MSFDNVSYANQSKKLPAGIGMLPSNEDELTETVVIPYYRKEDQNEIN